jgi:hypothetical protein
MISKDGLKIGQRYQYKIDQTNKDSFIVEIMAIHNNNYASFIVVQDLGWQIKVGSIVSYQDISYARYHYLPGQDK